MLIGSVFQVFPFDFKPSPPDVGSFLFYVRGTTIYLQDSAGTEIAFGSTTGIDQLSGEATGVGPGNAVVTLSNSAVIGKVLTGFTAGPNSPILATDTILQAFQKIQAQITAVAGTTLAGDVTGPFGTTVVAQVGGKTASQISQSVQDTIDATALATAQKIVKRDVNGDIAIRDLGVRNVSASGTVSGSNLSGTNTGDATVTDSDTVDLTLSGQDIKADVRISDATLTSDAGGLKVGTVPAAQVSGLAAVATSGNKADVGLSNVDNTSDVNKPVSTAQAAADTAVQNYAIQRSNHTGTQLASTISDFTEAAQDAVGATLADTDSVDMTYDDAGNAIKADVRLSDSTLAIDAGGLKVNSVPAGLITGFDEAAQDAIGAALLDTATVDLTYNDAANQISADVKDNSIADVKLTDSGATAGTYGSASKTVSAVVNAKGRVTSIAEQDIAILASQVTDFVEASQDAVGGALADTNSIDLTYDDVANQLKADLKLSTDPATAGYAKASATIHATGLHVEIQTDTPVQIGTSNFVGSGSGKLAEFDHIHAHGNQTSSTLHALATTGAHGFMSSTDKTKLDKISAAPGTNAQILISDGTSLNPRTISGDASVTNAGALTVVAVGGATAADVASATALALAATDLDTASTIMKRDASKNVHINGLLDDVANVVTWDIQNRRLIDINGKYMLDASENLQTISLIPNSDAIAQLHKTVSGGSAQFLIQNLATGGASSTDFVANADNGVDSNNYADFGINSSTYSDPTWTINGAGDAYLYNNDGSIAVGTSKVGAIVDIFTGGTLAANSRMKVKDNAVELQTRLTKKEITLTDAATIAIDASLGNDFLVTLGGNRTLGAPTNPPPAGYTQEIKIRIRQDGTGGRTLAYNAAYNFPPSLAGLSLSTSPNTFDYLGIKYNAVTSRWDVLALTPGLS
jgi:hypothetical protein